MCGRLDIIEAPILKWIGSEFNINIQLKTNREHRPTQYLTALYSQQQRVSAQTYQWGIKPDWSKRHIINAQGETVQTKKTFKHAFKFARCLVPCMGWYEWKDEGGPKKQKYAFSHASSTPLLMAAIGFASESGTQIVTITTKATESIGHIHHRMPLLLHPEMAIDWLETENQHQLDSMLMYGHQGEITYSKLA